MCGLFRNFHSQGFRACSSWSCWDWSRPPEGEAAAPTVPTVFFATGVGFICGELGALKSCQSGATWPQPSASDSLHKGASDSSHSRADLPRQERVVPPLKESSTILKDAFMT